MINFSFQESWLPFPVGLGSPFFLSFLELKLKLKLTVGNELSSAGYMDLSFSIFGIPKLNFP